MKIIIYGSQYGTTRRYADELGKRTAEVKAMIETYNKQVDFIDFSCLDEIVVLI